MHEGVGKVVGRVEDEEIPSIPEWISIFANGIQLILCID